MARRDWMAEVSLAWLRRLSMLGMAMSMRISMMEMTIKIVGLVLDLCLIDGAQGLDGRGLIGLAAEVEHVGDGDEHEDQHDGDDDQELHQGEAGLSPAARRRLVIQQGEDEFVHGSRYFHCREKC